MMRFWLSVHVKYRRMQNDRGVALIIVLLVTALLTALIFEFAYNTRVSLRAAQNFRDGQRAYFLARSGFDFFIKYAGMRDKLPQGEWGVVPLVSAGDTELRVRWEDEAGKINISGLRVNSAAFAWLTELFRRQNVSQEILDKIADSANQLQLLTELHKFMNDATYNKIAPYVTLTSVPSNKININTASEEVLRSVLATKSMISISAIVARRRDQPYTSADLTTDLTDFVATSNVFKVYFFATAGGYTTQIETIISNNTPVYWRAL
jgi:type II secretory pathway component PulK